MTTDRPVLELEGVSLCYRLAKQRIPSFKEYALHWVRGALTYEQLWALDGVSLTVARGEALGIIGPQRRRQEHAAEGRLAGAGALGGAGRRARAGWRPSSSWAPASTSS
jgi:hypothetical protein